MDSLNLILCLLNVFSSYTATMLNVVTIHAIRKTPSLSKNLKTLLLSLAVSDLGVGITAQPLYVAKLIIDSKDNNEISTEPQNAIYTACLIPTHLFCFATFFIVTVLCADRFMAIHFYFRYQTLVTHKRVVAVVVSVWAVSAVFPLVRLLIPWNIMYAVFGISESACIIAATFFSVRIYLSVRRHLNERQVLQLQQAPQTGQIINTERLRKFAIMAVHVCLILIVCYLPISVVLVYVVTSGSNNVKTHLLLNFGLTLVFVNSSLNPLIYCWKVKHIRHTIIGLLRNAVSKHN